MTESVKKPIKTNNKLAQGARFMYATQDKPLHDIDPGLEFFGYPTLDEAIQNDIEQGSLNFTHVYRIEYLGTYKREVTIIPPSK